MWVALVDPVAITNIVFSTVGVIVVVAVVDVPELDVDEFIAFDDTPVKFMA